jgi:hypothetical protein
MGSRSRITGSYLLHEDSHTIRRMTPLPWNSALSVMSSHGEPLVWMILDSCCFLAITHINYPQARCDGLLIAVSSNSWSSTRHCSSPNRILNTGHYKAA